MSTLVIAEHDHKSLKPVTLRVIGAAQKIGQPVTVLVAGFNATTVAEEAAKISGVSEVLHADAAGYEYFLAENVAPLIARVAGSFTHVMAATTANGKNILPRAAGLLEVTQISDIIAIEAPDIFVRPIYAGNAIATVQSKDKIKFITVRTTVFDAVSATGGQASIKKIDATAESGLSKFIRAELSKSERPELTSARVVVSGGRALGSSENFVAVLDPLAVKLKAALGASRAAVDAGYVPNDYQVGQTGKVVAPDLYIAVGISGAIQHLAGMKDSKVIVAINKDADAPIFQVADYGIVGDLFQIVPELTQAL